MDVLSALNIKPQNSGVFAANLGWLAQNKTTMIHSINPSTEQVIAIVDSATQQDYEKIICAATEAFHSWRQVPAPKRGELIRLLGDELRANKDFLGTLISLEMGKIKQEGDGEVQEMIDMADFAVGQARMLYGKTMHSERPQHRMYEQWHPLGPVGVITAFNFPMAVWAWNAFIAAICGNTVIWKPSSKVPLCAIAVQHICQKVCERAGYPQIFSLFITEQNEVAQCLTEDKRVPLISFTGSIPVGRSISAQVAKRFGKCILELSGNNAVIVDHSANLDLAINAIVFGAVGTAGQRCTTTRRLIVHEKIYSSLVERLQRIYLRIPIGDPLESGTLMGPLIDQLAIANYENALNELKKLDAEILYGGKVLKRKGYFVEPTLVRAENYWDIVQRETFAPILYLMTFTTIEEAVQLNNTVPQGLSSALFTENLQHSEYFLSALGSDCGIANINIGTSGAEIGGAFGGEKETGGGREAGSDVWKDYMRRQTNTINWGRELPLAQGIKFSLD